MVSPFTFIIFIIFTNSNTSLTLYSTKSWCNGSCKLANYSAVEWYGYFDMFRIGRKTTSGLWTLIKLESKEMYILEDLSPLQIYSKMFWCCFESLIAVVNWCSVFPMKSLHHPSFPNILWSLSEKLILCVLSVLSRISIELYWNKDSVKHLWSQIKHLRRNIFPTILSRI